MSARYFSFSTALFMALPLSMPGQVLAQAAGSQNSALEEIVVTAQRRAENLQSTPVSVTAFSADRLRDLNVSDPQALADVVPNFSIGNGTGNASDAAAVSIRGMSEALVTPVVDPAVGIYIDDIYYGRPQLSFLRLIDVERVEVLRGPQGTLFGKNTTGGAVRYISKRPDFDGVSGHVHASVGDYSSQEISAAINVPLSDTVAIRAKAATVSREGYLNRLSDGYKLGAKDSIYSSAQLRWQPSDRLNIVAAIDYSKSDTDSGPLKLIDYFNYNGGMPGLGDVGGAAVTRVWNNYWGGTPLAYNAEIPDSLYEVAGGSLVSSSISESTGASLNIEFGLTDDITFKSLTGYRTVDDFRRQDHDDQASAITYFDRTREGGVDFWSQELQLSGVSFDSRLNWVAGLYYSNEEPFEHFIDDRDARDIESVLIDKSRSLQQTKSTGIYAQGTFDITDRLAVTAGIRWSEDDKQYTIDNYIGWDQNLADMAVQFGLPALENPLAAGFNCDPSAAANLECLNISVTGGDKFSSTTPRFAVEYQWSDDLMTYLSASKGFKSGGTNDSIADVTAPFAPEEVWSYELGLRSEWLENRLRFNATYFFSDYEGKQITFAPIGGIVSPCTNRCIQNAGNAEISGLEVESIWVVTDMVQLHANIGTIDAEWKEIFGSPGVTTSSDFALSPKLSYNVGARFDFPLASGSAISATLDYSFKDDQESSPQDSTSLTIPSYSLLMARIKYVPDNADWEVSLYCTNCADEKYIYGGAAWAGATDNTNFPYKESTSHPAFVDGTVNPRGVAPPDISYVLVGAPRMWGVDFRYRF